MSAPAYGPKQMLPGYDDADLVDLILGAMRDAQESGSTLSDLARAAVTEMRSTFIAKAHHELYPELFA